MIVIAIIGILAAIAIPQFNQYRIRAYNGSALTDARNGFTAAQAYFVDYPDRNACEWVISTAYGLKTSTGR